MTAERSARRPRFRASGWLVPSLDAVLEGAWIAVLEAAFAAVGHTTALGPIPFAVAAGASLYVTRRAADKQTAYIGLGIIYVAAFIAGALLGRTGEAGFAQGGAAFMALAVFRGSRHGDVLDDDLVNGSLLQWGFPLMAAPWLFAAQLTQAERDVFAATAFPSTLLFAGTGLLALGLARLDTLASLSGVDWRSNRAWFVLLLSVLGVMLLIAVPAAFLIGAPIVLLAAGLLGPLSFVLGPIGFVFEKVITLIFFLIQPIIDFITNALGHRPPEQQPPDAGNGPLVPPEVANGEQSTLALIIGIAIIVLIVVVMFLIVLRLTYRPRARDETTPDAPLEEREFRLPKLGFRRPRVGLPVRHPRPTTASGAYLAFLADLDAAPHLARRPDEPPATHAARLREAGFRDPRAGLLAADYELERYALRDLPPRETARALRRWEALKAAIRLAPGPPAADLSGSTPSSDPTR